ncbi:hypothetical protein CDG76_33660 [Nostoc sp. 'Peltigera membranacea cyanobiont' 210A]|nr:hypothetical protein CDG76_33660 [Nostoc sp. 'Peltigera membranacea cyanobiont' 210A]
MKVVPAAGGNPGGGAGGISRGLGLGKLALGRLAFSDRPLGVALLATVLYVQKPKSAIAAPMPPLVKIQYGSVKAKTLCQSQFF